MRAKLLFLLIPVIVLAACSKQKYATKPRLELKEIKPGSKIVNQGDILVFDFLVFDKEGDVKDSIFIETTHVGVPACGVATDTMKYTIPEYPSSTNSKADFRIQFEYATNNTNLTKLSPVSCSPARNDTAVFRFWVKDNGGNISDPVSTDRIVLMR